MWELLDFLVHRLTPCELLKNHMIGIILNKPHNHTRVWLFFGPCFLDPITSIDQGCLLD
jgi:hypothetical protein